VNGRQARRPLSAWLARGVKSADGSLLAASDDATALLLPAGPKGPAFLVHRNFDAIYSYNAAESYALAIAHLSDRLRGRGPLLAAWPTDDPGLSRRERRELQELLVARGHDIGEVDGMIGSRSREALKLEQARVGQPADGRAGQRILRALREPSPQP
jgi:glucose-6-phosphate 1-epimerase